MPILGVPFFIKGIPYEHFGSLNQMDMAVNGGDMMRIKNFTEVNVVGDYWSSEAIPH